MLKWLREFFAGKPVETKPEIIPTEQKSVVVDTPLDVNKDGKVDLDDAKEVVKQGRAKVKSMATKAKGRPKKVV